MKCNIFFIFSILTFAKIVSTLKALQLPQKRAAKSSLMVCLNEHKLASIVTGDTGKFKYSFNEMLNSYKVHIFTNSMTPDQVTSNIGDYICNKFNNKNQCMKKVKICSNIFLSLLSEESQPSLISKLQKKMDWFESESLHNKENYTPNIISTSHNKKPIESEPKLVNLSHNKSNTRTRSFSMNPKLSENVEQPRNFKENKQILDNRDLSHNKVPNTVLTAPTSGLKLSKPIVNQVKPQNFTANKPYLLNEDLSRNKEQRKPSISEKFIPTKVKISENVEPKYIKPNKQILTNNGPVISAFVPPSDLKFKKPDVNQEKSRNFIPSKPFLENVGVSRENFQSKHTTSEKSVATEFSFSNDVYPSQYFTPSRSFFQDIDFPSNQVSYKPLESDKSFTTNFKVSDDKKPLRYFSTNKKYGTNVNLASNKIQLKPLTSNKTTNVEPSDDILPSRYMNLCEPSPATLDLSFINGQSEPITPNVDPTDMLLPSRYEEPKRSLLADIDLSHFEAPVIKSNKPTTTIERSPIFDYLS